MIPDVVKDGITFTCPFDTFTFRRTFFDLGIKSEGTDKNCKVKGHLLKLFHESPTLEEETIKELSLGKATYAIIYPPWFIWCVLSSLLAFILCLFLSLRTMCVLSVGEEIIYLFYFLCCCSLFCFVFSYYKKNCILL